MKRRWQVISILAASFIASSALAANYVIDQNHSSITFRVKHWNISYVYGFFKEFGGTLTTDDATGAPTGIAVDVSVTSVDTNVIQRDNALRRAPMFNVRQWPTMSFRATSISETDRDDVYELTGDLTLRGVTRPITLSLEKVGAGVDGGTPVIGLIGTFAIRRTDFGMAGELSNAGDNVEITVAIEARQSS